MKQLLHLRTVAIALMLFAFSLPAFSQPFVEVLQPSEPNIYWELGSEKLISWNSNFTKPVRIDLINEDFVFGDPEYSTEIAASVSGSTYTWFIDPVTFTAGSNYKIKVTSTVNSSFSDDSENAFSLVASLPGSYLKVEQPNTAGITWVKGTTNIISWDCNVPGTFKIRLLDYSGGTPPVSTVIANGVEGSTYEWTIPGTVANGSEYRIRVVSETDPDIKDRSDNEFAISDVPDGAEIEVLQPSENNISWLRGEEYLISWIDNVPDPVNIELYSSVPFTIASDQADDYLTWVDGSDEGTGFGPWVITSGTTTGTASAFLGDPSLSSIDNMDNPSFGIVAYSAISDLDNYIYADNTFDLPLEVGSTFSFDWGIRWSTGEKGFIIYSGGIGSDQLLEVSIKGITSEIQINGATMFTNNGQPLSQSMNLNFEMVSETELRVFGTGRDGIETYDENFTISGAPDAIRFYSKGQVEADYINRINYFNNLTIKRHTLDIANGVVGSTYSWLISPSIPTGSTYKVRVWDASETIVGESEYFFSIVGSLPGSFITVEQPNEPFIEWIRGSSYLISWNDNIPGSVNIYLTQGATQHTLATGIEGSTWVWNVPLLTYPIGNYKIKVGNSSLTDESDNTFALVDYPSGGAIEVLQPSVPGIVWLRGSSYLISWLPDFLSGPVNVELWKGGVKQVDLVTNYEGSTWIWDIPQNTYPVDNDYTIKVISNNGATGESANPFSLADTPGGTIEVLQPNGGEILYKGVGYLIAWIDDVPEPVRIILHNDATNTTEVLANNVIGSTWVWNVPSGQANGTEYRIRVRSIYSNTIRDFSDGQFTITDLPMTFSVYPNPVRDEFTVKFDEMANESFTVQLKDKYNMTVLEQQINAKQMKELKLETSGIANGIYFLTITSETSRNTQKILIQR